MALTPQILRELPEPGPNVLPGIDLELALPSRTIVTGARVDARIVVSNRTGEELSITTGEPLLAVIVLPGTRSVVGAYTGAVGGHGRGLRLGPGTSDSLRAIVVAWGRSKSSVLQLQHLHEDLAPGLYGVLVPMPFYGHRHDHQRQEVWSGEVPIEVIAASP